MTKTDHIKDDSNTSTAYGINLHEWYQLNWTQTWRIKCCSLHFITELEMSLR